jgi:hypothetical protein
MTAQGLRPRGPDGPAPTAFIPARFRRSRSETVGGWASPIVSAHRHSAAAPSLRDGAPGPELLRSAMTAIGTRPGHGLLIFAARRNVSAVNSLSAGWAKMPSASPSPRRRRWPRTSPGRSPSLSDSRPAAATPVQLDGIQRLRVDMAKSALAFDRWDSADSAGVEPSTALAPTLPPGPAAA